MDTSRMHTLARILCLALALGAAPSFAAPAHAQESTPAPADRLARNSIYVELLGSGILYSVNYDRRFTDRVSGRAGAMLIGAAVGGLTFGYITYRECRNEECIFPVGPIIVGVALGTAGGFVVEGITRAVGSRRESRSGL